MNIYAHVLDESKPRLAARMDAPVTAPTSLDGDGAAGIRGVMRRS